MEQRLVSALNWNARRGDVWTDLQPIIDKLFLPFEQLLADSTYAHGARNVLDIGCGAGATTLAIARRLGPGGTCMGLDISEALLKIARSRAETDGLVNAQFALGDAQRHCLDPAAFDAVVSRFGVMFFDDPEAAFSNIRAAVRPGGTLTCIVWRRPEENPFMTAAERATESLLGHRDIPEPYAPGPFAFADADRVKAILAAANWNALDIAALDVPCALPTTDLERYTHNMGPVGLILPDLDLPLRERVITALDDAFATFVTGDAARFTAACWLVQARAG